MNDGKIVNAGSGAPVLQTVLGGRACLHGFDRLADEGRWDMAGGFEAANIGVCLGRPNLGRERRVCSGHGPDASPWA